MNPCVVCPPSNLYILWKDFLVRVILSPSASAGEFSNLGNSNVHAYNAKDVFDPL
jgi:hypothetical protein